MSEEQWQDPQARAQSDNYAAFDVDTLNDKARRAAREICSSFDVRQPRGVSYHNTIEETIAIIVAQNMRGAKR